MRTPDLRRKFYALQSRVAWAVLALVVARHFAAIWKYADNVPWWDEWDALLPGRLGPRLTWDFLTAFHGEHRTVWNNLLTWILYRLDGWRLPEQVAISFVLYLGVIGALCLLKRITLGAERLRVWPWFLLPWASTVAYENLDWGFQCSFHFGLLFFLLAACALFRERPVWWTDALAGAAIFGSIFAFAGGMFACAGMLAGWIPFAWMGSLEGKRGAGRRILLLVTMLAISIALWFHHFVEPPGVPAFVWPDHLGYWEYLCQLIGGGFGFGGTPFDAPIGAAALIVLIGSIKNGMGSRAFWAWLSVALGVLFTLGVTAIGRANWKVVAPRYQEISLLLVYPTLILADLALRERPALARWKTLFPGVFLAFIMAGFVSQYDFSVYAIKHRLRQEALQCLHRFYAQGGSGFCRTAWPWPIPDRYLRARELKLSFTQEMPK